MRRRRRAPRTQHRVTFDFVVKLHNIIEPEQNPAEYYHTMGSSSVALAGRRGQKNTTTGRVPVNNDASGCGEPIQSGPYHLQRRFILRGLIMEFRRSSQRGRLAGVRRRQPIMSPTTV